MPEVQLLPLAKILRDGNLQPREALNAEVLKEYIDLWKAAAPDHQPFLPVDVLFDGAQCYLVDGYHRCEAGEQAGRAQISARVSHGTYRDAILLSCAANAKHGLRRTHADKRRAVHRLLE